MPVLSEITALSLEPYKSRYTEWLSDIERKAFESAGLKYKSVLPKTADAAAVLEIQSGRVLDSYNRPIWAMQQVCRLLAEGGRDFGKLWFSDFFHPGLEALPYCGSKFDAFSFLWAQTFDAYDFTVPMTPWMRPWEIAAFEIYSTVFVACDELRDLIVTALPSMSEKVVVSGLPFDSQHVAGLLKPESVPQEDYDVVYSSRWDSEKCPQLFLTMVRERPDLRFVVCTGHADLTGNALSEITEARKLAARPDSNLFLHTGLSKSDYYGILSKSRVQFNSSMQDWVSYTLLEALTFGCTPLYPAHRSFPGTLFWEQRHLYRPLDPSDALDKLDDLLATPISRSLSEAVLERHDSALPLIASHIKAS